MRRYVIYARGHRAPDLHSRIYVPIFYNPESARAWLDFFTDNEEVSIQREGNRLLLGGGVSVESEQLDEILKAEADDSLTQIDERRMLRFKHGTWDERHEKPITAVEKQGSVVERERRPERPTGYVTITELCTASGMPAMQARALLRASGRVKPDYGWAFAPHDVPAIKAICGME